MRVIAGEKRHLILKTLDSLSIRPTTDKIKETLFNMIQFDISGVSFLDLFAGSGAIGIEALSRGAKKAVFVDNNIEAINVIKENLTHTKLLDKAKVVRMDAVTFADKDKTDESPYGIVFMDPPYDSKLYIEALKNLSKGSLINSDSMIIIETNIKDDFSTVLQYGYDIIKEKKYKSNKHVFLKKRC